jgi:hypothetical protein
MGRGKVNRALVCLLVLIGFVATGASAQQEEEIRAFTVKSVTRSAWLSVRDQWLVFDLPFSGLSTTRNGHYREGVELSFAGSVYHPNLMSYVLNSRLGFAQWEGTGANSAAPAQELTANIHFLTNWLQKKPFSFSLYADRKDDFPEYNIFDRAQVSQSALGGIAHWTNGVAPLSLSLEKSWTQEQQTSWSSAEEALVLRLGLDGTSADQNSVGRAGYAFTDFARAVADFPGQIGQSHEARLSHTLAFGGRDRSRLASSVRYLDLTGTLQQDTLSLAENLEVELPWSFAGQASYNLLGNWDPSSSAITHQGRLALKQQLYESLTTTLGAHGTLTTATGYSQGIVGPDLDMRYKKNVGIGFLSLGYALNTDFEGRQTSALSFHVAGERHVLQDGTVTFLDYPGVDPATLAVSDETGTVAYTAGVDYSVTAVNGRLQLRRLPGGRIANQAAVLVAYTAASDPSFQHLALSQEAGVRLALFSDSVSLSYLYKRRRYPSVSGAPPQTLESIDDHRAGLALDLPPFSGSVEFEHYGSSALPYDSLRIQEGLSWHVTPGSLLSFQGVQSFVWFSPAEMQSFLELVARYSVTAAQSLDLSAAGGYRLHGDAGSPSPSSVWSAEAGLDFHQGALKITAGYRFTGPGNVASLLDHSLYVTMTREF